MTLNTYIAGDPASGHALADFLTRRADTVHDKATGWHDARATAEAEWEGAASEAFVANRATPNARDADALAQIDRALAPPFTTWSDGITAAKAWMERAKQVARDGELHVLGDAIFPPKSFEHLTPEAPIGQITAADNAAHAQAKAESDAAKALHAKQQAAFDEAKALVQQARDLERTSHDQLRDALTRQTDALKHLGQFKQWAQTAASATTPAAADLMGLATDLENKSVRATYAAFEKAAGQSPFATNSMWSVLTSEQRADLISRCPQMVGSTNGVPVVDRDLANRSLIASQRQAIVDRIRQLEKRQADREHPVPGTSGEIKQLEEALSGIDKIEDILGPVGSGHYLLGLDSTTDSRGRVIIATGNPDLADHTVTFVPGTGADLGGVGSDVRTNDMLVQRANELAPRGQEVAGILWTDYQTPPNIPSAASGYYMGTVQESLSDFQEGLKATHTGEGPGHNTVLGHSYGSPVVGEAARDHDMAADDLIFIGSPGVGVDNVLGLGMPPDHVWSGTAGKDPIDSFAPHPHPVRWVTDWVSGSDSHRYGMDPSDPWFGGNIMPTDPNGNHTDYWTRRTSMDAMARIVNGQASEGHQQQ